MSLSTSSSDHRGRRRFYVALTVPLAALLLLEVLTRTWLFSSSKDFRRFRTYPDRAAQLVARDGFRVALVGNSATDRGVDGALFRAALERRAGRPVAADLFVADRSRVNTWHFILERYFFSQGRRPDLFLVTFYENDLEDGNSVEIGRLAQFFTTVVDWPSVFQVDLPDFGQRVEFVLSSGWAAFAARERIKERALGVIVPRYKPFAEHVNDINYRYQQAQAGPRTSTHRALERLLRRAQDLGVRLCFVAYPTRPSPAGPYEVGAEALRLIREAGMEYVDLRRAPGLPARLYADEVHLSEEGRPLFSQMLAQAVGPLVRPDGSGAPPTRQARRRPLQGDR